MSRHYVWLTTLGDALIDAFMGCMVKMGYTISALAETGAITWTTENFSLGNLSAFDVEFRSRSRSRQQTMTDIKQVLKELEFSYFSVIVTEPCMSTWNSGIVKKDKNDDESPKTTEEK